MMGMFTWCVLLGKGINSSHYNKMGTETLHKNAWKLIIVNQLRGTFKHKMTLLHSNVSLTTPISAAHAVLCTLREPHYIGEFATSPSQCAEMSVIIGYMTSL